LAVKNTPKWPILCQAGCKNLTQLSIICGLSSSESKKGCGISLIQWLEHAGDRTCW